MEKRLYKSTQDSYIDGVCGGIAEYFNVDSTWVRLGLVAFCFMGGSGVLAYIIAMFVMPERPKIKTPKNAKQRAKADNYAAYADADDYTYNPDDFANSNSYHNEEYNQRSNGPRPPQ